jgi:cytochrome c oxidase subunit 3
MLERERLSARETGIEEQFEDHSQQAESARLGVWIFLGTEVLFFGALLVAYAVYRWSYPEAFRLAGHETDLAIGTWNTAILLTSSYAMASAVARAEREPAESAGLRKGVVLRLVAVFLLGLAFLGLKALEYGKDFAKHLLPGSPTFPIGGENSGPARLFYWLYYAMTGLHALHLGIALGLVAWTIFRFARARDTPFRRMNALRGVGLYWHFVDAVWVVLYPLLYLIDRSSH